LNAVVIEADKLVYPVPNFLVRGVENVRAVDMDIDAVSVLGVHVATDMAAFL
jgi:hypothetical protein